MPEDDEEQELRYVDDESDVQLVDDDLEVDDFELDDDDDDDEEEESWRSSGLSKRARRLIPLAEEMAMTKSMSRKEMVEVFIV